MSVDVAAALAAKVEGQARAGRKLTPEHWDLLATALDQIPAGAWFTANDLRQPLLSVPASARASLIALAAHRGLIEKVTVQRGGRVFELAEKSTGRSARRAGVVVYERMPVRATSAGAS